MRTYVPLGTNRNKEEEACSIICILFNILLFLVFTLAALKLVPQLMSTRILLVRKPLRVALSRPTAPVQCKLLCSLSFDLVAFQQHVATFCKFLFFVFFFLVQTSSRLGVNLYSVCCMRLRKDSRFGSKQVCNGLTVFK